MLSNEGLIITDGQVNVKTVILKSDKGSGQLRLGNEKTSANLHRNVDDGYGLGFYQSGRDTAHCLIGLGGKTNVPLLIFSDGNGKPRFGRSLDRWGNVSKFED